MSERALARWDTETVFDDGDEYFANMLSGIASAKTSIEFETYIFQPGILADRVVEAFRQAIKRGVKLRIMVDGVGSPLFWSQWGKELSAMGAEVKLFRTLPWHWLWGHKVWAKVIIEFFSVWVKLNRGSHRKFCLIDGRVGWIGSFNISDTHLREVYGDLAWLDCGVRVTGRELEKIRLAHGRSFIPGSIMGLFRGTKLLIFNNSFVFGQRTEAKNLKRMKHARHRIWIQTPYFVPIGPVYRTLLRKARQGTDVRIMVPRITDVPVVKSLSFAFFDKLLNAGVKIFEYTPRFAHQKILQVDAWCCIGSSNMNHRSFLHDLELDVVVTHPGNKYLLRQKFLAEQSESLEITRKGLAKKSLLAKVWSYSLLLIRYWC